MNIAKVKEALADAKKEKRHAEADGNSDYAYWQGYEEGILMALSHMEEEIEKDNVKDFLRSHRCEKACQELFSV